MKLKKPKVPLKYHGGKVYLATTLIGIEQKIKPSPIHHVETHCGGCAWTLAHNGNNVSELINDIDKGLTNFWLVLQDGVLFEKFKRRMEATPLSRLEFDDSKIEIRTKELNVDNAIKFFIRCRQSMAGRMKSFTPPTRTRLRRGMNGNVSEWLSAVDGLYDVHNRLKRIFIENMDANELIIREDKPTTLFYCDPPYVQRTRVSKNVYAYEMDLNQHIELLKIIKECKGKVMISGYNDDVYVDNLSLWNQHKFNVPNNAASGKTKRLMEEIVWCNF